MLRHADLLAHVEDRAGCALGQSARANVLPEGHEQAVELDPVVARQFVRMASVFSGVAAST